MTSATSATHATHFHVAWNVVWNVYVTRIMKCSHKPASYCRCFMTWSQRAICCFISHILYNISCSILNMHITDIPCNICIFHMASAKPKTRVGTWWYRSLLRVLCLMWHVLSYYIFHWILYYIWHTIPHYMMHSTCHFTLHDTLHTDVGEFLTVFYAKYYHNKPC